MSFSGFRLTLLNHAPAGAFGNIVRIVLAWQLSNTLESSFCLDALQQALLWGKPAIFNTAQGVQFTSNLFTDCLLKAEIQISMDGRGRALDNIFTAPQDSLINVKPQCDENQGSSQFGARRGSRPKREFFGQQRPVQLFLLCRGPRVVDKRV